MLCTVHVPDLFAVVGMGGYGIEVGTLSYRTVGGDVIGAMGAVGCRSDFTLGFCAEAKVRAVGKQAEKFHDQCFLVTEYGVPELGGCGGIGSG